LNRAPTLLLAIVLCALTPVGTAQEGPVWFWLATCDGPAMALEVRFEKAIVFKAEVPLCRTDRSSVASQGQRVGFFEFHFRATQAIVWEGYRDTDNKTKAGELLEGNLWQAGADPDALIIGVSFSNSRTILMNTLHIAHPGQHDESQIANGLRLISSPVAPKNAPQN